MLANMNKVNQTEVNQETQTNQTEVNQTETNQTETNQTEVNQNTQNNQCGVKPTGLLFRTPVTHPNTVPTTKGFGMAFQPAHTKTNSCFGPIPPSYQNGGFMGLGGCVQRHPETGIPFPPTNSQCFNLPRVINNINNTEDKKKYIDSIYTELSMIRQQVDKLNRSIDTMYELIRHI